MKIRQCFRELQLKTSGVFFEIQCSYAKHSTSASDVSFLLHMQI